MLAGATLVLLAAFSPWALLRLLPLHELTSGLDGLRSRPQPLATTEARAEETTEIAQAHPPPAAGGHAGCRRTGRGRWSGRGRQALAGRQRSGRARGERVGSGGGGGRRRATRGGGAVRARTGGRRSSPAQTGGRWRGPAPTGGRWRGPAPTGGAGGPPRPRTAAGAVGVGHPGRPTHRVRRFKDPVARDGPLLPAGQRQPGRDRVGPAGSPAGPRTFASARTQRAGSRTSARRPRSAAARPGASRGPPVSERRLTYTFGPLERRGMLGPLRAGQAAVLAGGMLVAIVLIDHSPSAAGALIALLVVRGRGRGELCAARRPDRTGVGADRRLVRGASGERRNRRFRLRRRCSAASRAGSDAREPRAVRPGPGRAGRSCAASGSSRPPTASARSARSPSTSGGG